jgi:hypothetical protein
MIINYIYDTKGHPEYAVIPFFIWQKIGNDIDDKLGSKKKRHNLFNPKDFKGILSHLSLDIENEIQEMRNEWTRNIL